jgi:hypothetical protein
MASTLKVKKVTILDDTFAKPIDRFTGVVGLNVKNLNVQVELTGHPAASTDPPSKLDLTVLAREPDPKRLRSDKGSMSGPLTVSALRTGKVLIYWASVTLDKLAPFMKAGDSQLEVATVRRVRTGSDGGHSSDEPFRQVLTDGGWALRGAGIQPATNPKGTTGDKATMQPDALTLFQAGGVEVLEVTVKPTPDVHIGASGTEWAFVRSPADVFFYTGHAAWWDGCMLIDTGGHHYKDWLAPDKYGKDNVAQDPSVPELLSSWQKNSADIQRSPMDLDVLIFNGCSVLYWDGTATTVPKWDGKNTPAVGLLWRKFLTTQQGPLVAILGYRDTAPLDRDGGITVAKKMAEAMVKLGNDWENYPRKWMEINKPQKNTRTAAAIDRKNYWWIDDDGNIQSIPW